MSVPATAISMEACVNGQMKKLMTLTGLWYELRYKQKCLFHVLILKTRFSLMFPVRLFVSNKNDLLKGRGSQNPSTGPVMDRASYTHGGSSGGYAFIDSSFPRRSGDKARLTSREFFSTSK